MDHQLLRVVTFYSTHNAALALVFWHPSIRWYGSCHWTRDGLDNSNMYTLTLTFTTAGNSCMSLDCGWNRETLLKDHCSNLSPSSYKVGVLTITLPCHPLSSIYHVRILPVHMLEPLSQILTLKSAEFSIDSMLWLIKRVISCSYHFMWTKQCSQRW